jgi:hypothetical protein
VKRPVELEKVEGWRSAANDSRVVAPGRVNRVAQAKVAALVEHALHAHRSHLRQNFLEGAYRAISISSVQWSRGSLNVYTRCPQSNRGSILEILRTLISRPGTSERRAAAKSG